MHTGRSLVSLHDELKRQADSKVDYLADTSTLTMVPSLSADASVKMMVPAESGPSHQYPIKSWAHRQIGARLKIPAVYYDRMAERDAGLLCDNVNAWFRNEPEKRMLRVLDDRLRAFLSDRYNRIDNYDVAMVVIPILEEHGGLQLRSCEVTEQKLYIKATTPRLRGEVAKGDVVEGGLVFANSEIGGGSTSVQPFFNRLICLNGMVVPQYGQKRRHVGRQLEDEGELVASFADDTRAADDKAFILKLRDTVAALLSEDFFGKICNEMRLAAGDKILGDPVKTVEVLGKAQRFNDIETAGVLRRLIEGADLSRWGLANAITAQAGAIADYDRATELETIGGNLVTLPPSEWETLAEAA